MTIRNTAAALLAGAALLAAATPSFAADKTTKGDKARYSDAKPFLGTPDLKTTVDLIAAGGGATAPTPGTFSTVPAFKALAGDNASPELAKLTKEYGSDGVATFVKTFDFVIADATKQVVDAKVALPTADAPLPDGKTLSAKLYTLGVTPTGTFDVEYMLDALVTHPIHVKVMNDIDANPDLGPKADASYHAVLTEVMNDLKVAYGLN